MTVVVPGSGAGGRACGICGAIFDGGRITPSVRSSRSLRVSPGRASAPVERRSCGPLCACGGLVWANASGPATWTIIAWASRVMIKSGTRICVTSVRSVCSPSELVLRTAVRPERSKQRRRYVEASGRPRRHGSGSWRAAAIPTADRFQGFDLRHRRQYDGETPASRPQSAPPGLYPSVHSNVVAPRTTGQ